MHKFVLSPTFGLACFSDLEKQPGFRQGVKLEEELKNSTIIVEPYNIGPDLVPCGLTCHQGHNKGYLVLLPDGSHTNVGRNCGSKHFGASNFDDQVRSAQAIERSQKNMQSINELIDLIPAYRKQAHDLWDHAKPLSDALDYFKSLYPDGLHKDLRNRAQRKNSTVSITRRLDETEKAALTQNPQTNIQGNRGGKKSDFVQKRVGELRGLSIFHMRPRSCLKSVWNLIDEIESQNSEAVTPSLLAKYAKYKGLIEELLAHAASLLEAGDKFFEAENFELLRYLLEGKYAEEVEVITWDFDRNEGRRLTYGQLKKLRKRRA